MRNPIISLHLFALLGSMALADFLLGNPFVGAFACYAFMFVAAGLRPSSADDPLAGLAAYRMFSRMSLYARAAMELGVTMFFCHELLLMGDVDRWLRYLVLAGTLLLMTLAGGLFARHVRGRWSGMALAEFAVGAAVWVLGDIFLLTTGSAVGGLGWSIVWLYGIVLTGAGLIQLAEDFAAVGRLSGEPGGDKAVERGMSQLGRRSSLVSGGVTMLVMAVWLWGNPWLQRGSAPRIVEVTMMQLPVLLMLVAFYFALRNPLDRHNRERLTHYLQARTSNERMKANLQRLLGKKAPFGSRLLCWLAMPFFLHKIVGRENLRTADYPSVFVCNHGFLYGPIVAALYLPTYFRPWIHNRMLDEAMAAREIELSFPWVKRLLGRKAARWLYRAFARMVVRLLLSFRPIPVVRGNSRDATTTFDLSLQALEEGDNLLLFPEKPKRLADDPEAGLRNLYTGFAHIGKLYHDATGRSLLFYPIYSDHRRRTFSIGSPVRYNPALPPREAKRDVAEQLQRLMSGLMGSDD